MVVTRIIISCILLFSVLFLPFWVSVAIAIIGMIAFRYYFEAVVLLLLSDLLFGAPTARFYNFTFVSFTLSLVLLIVIEFVKDKLKFKF